MSTIRFTCISCTRTLVIEAEGAGLELCCPDCGEVVVVPRPAAAHSGQDGEHAFNEFKYDAFISYRHTELDRRWARWVQRRLERYRVPRDVLRFRKLPKRLKPVFLDQEELAAASDLSDEIRTALRQSRFLIVICSPRTPESRWVNDEVKFFRALGRDDRILALLIEGEPHESFPQALCEIRRMGVSADGRTFEQVDEVEPLASDVRASTTGGKTRLKRLALLRIVARILGCKFDDLRRRDAERRREQAVMWLAAAAGFAFLVSIGMTTLWGIAVANDRRAKQALAELRETAPTFYEKAQRLLGEQNFDAALKEIAYAIKLRPDEPAYFTFRGHVLEGLLRIEEAQQAYRLALKSNPTHLAAAENEKLCTKLLSQKKAGGFPETALLEFQRELESQQRFVEALALLPHLKNAQQRFLAEWREKLAERRVKGTLQLREKGLLDLTIAKMSDLNSLRGMPLESLTLLFSPEVRDLSPLQGMPLRELTLQEVGIRNLEALRGLRLNMLTLIHCKELRDISAVKDLPLGNFRLDSSSSWDLSVLRGKKLHQLSIEAPIKDLNFLAGMPLRNYNGPLPTNLAIFRGMPLVNLRSEVPGKTENFAFLRELPVTELFLHSAKIETLDSFVGSKLNVLSLRHSVKLTNIEAVASMRISSLDLSGCTNLHDFSPLVRCQKLNVLVLPRHATNIAFLRPQPSLKFLGYDVYFQNAMSASNFWMAYERKFPQNTEVK